MKISSLIVFVLGVIALYVSPVARQCTHTQMGIAVGLVALIALIVGGLVHLTFRGLKKDKKKKQSSGYGYAARGRS